MSLSLDTLNEKSFPLVSFEWKRFLRNFESYHRGSAMSSFVLDADVASRSCSEGDKLLHAFTANNRFFWCGYRKLS